MISNFREVPMFKRGFANLIGFFEKKFRVSFLFEGKKIAITFSPQVFHDKGKNDSVLNVNDSYTIIKGVISLF